MTYSELQEAATALTECDQKGFLFLNYGWFFEELVAAQKDGGCCIIYAEYSTLVH